MYFSITKRILCTEHCNGFQNHWFPLFSNKRNTTYWNVMKHASGDSVVIYQQFFYLDYVRSLRIIIMLFSPLAVLSTENSARPLTHQNDQRQKKYTV